MALNIKNREVESLVNEVTAITGETKTEAIRKALIERKAKLANRVSESKEERLMAYLEEEVWPMVPGELLGKPITEEEQDEILGFGSKGI